METLQFKICVCGRYVSKRFKKHSAVVAKKEFQQKKAFNFFKNIY